MTGLRAPAPIDMLRQLDAHMAQINAVFSLGITPDGADQQHWGHARALVAALMAAQRSTHQADAA